MATETESDSAATGGFLVILGILVAILAAVLIYKGGFLGNHDTEVKIETPAVIQPVTR